MSAARASGSGAGLVKRGGGRATAELGAHAAGQLLIRYPASAITPKYNFR